MPKKKAPKTSAKKAKKPRKKKEVMPERRVKWEVEVTVGKKTYTVRRVLIGEIDRSLELSDSELEKIRTAFLQSYGYRQVTLEQFKIFEITKA